MLESISQIKGQIVIKLAGDDLAEMKRVTEEIAREVKQVQGVARAEIDREGQVPQLLIDIDRDRAARYGLNVSDIQDVIEAALAGKAATNLWEGERKFAVAVPCRRTNAPSPTCRARPSPRRTAATCSWATSRRSAKARAP